MSAAGTRARVRAELTREIADVARAHLATSGAAALSLRAVARELGMASSAVYRYFPSRDDLLTTLIVDAYDALGSAAEAAERTAGPEPLARWHAVWRATREWAVAHPHEYALVYGSPVPGYAAPQATIGPAGRVGILLARIVGDARGAGSGGAGSGAAGSGGAGSGAAGSGAAGSGAAGSGAAGSGAAGSGAAGSGGAGSGAAGSGAAGSGGAGAGSAGSGSAGSGVGGGEGSNACGGAGAEGADAALAPGLGDQVGLGELPPGSSLLARVVVAWTSLFGLISFELFGHTHNVVVDHERHFAEAADRIGRDLGLAG